MDNYKWFIYSIYNSVMIDALVNVYYGRSVRSWCDGSSDRSFMVDSSSYIKYVSGSILK